MPLIDHVPPEPTVVVLAAVELVPSLAMTEMIAPTSPVPLIDVEVAFAMSIGFVTLVTATAGGMVSFVAVFVTDAELLLESVAVTL